MKIIKKTKEEFIAAAEKHTDPCEIVYEFHRLLITDFDERPKLNGYVKCSRETYLELAHIFCDRLESLGRPRLQMNFTWMNYGFSTDEKLLDWEFDISEAIK